MGFKSRGAAIGTRGCMPTIALVDDDRNILTSVSIALEAEGYRIMTYTDGASALDGIGLQLAKGGSQRSRAGRDYCRRGCFLCHPFELRPSPRNRRCS